MLNRGFFNHRSGLVGMDGWANPELRKSPRAGAFGPAAPATAPRLRTALRVVPVGAGDSLLLMLSVKLAGDEIGLLSGEIVGNCAP